MDKPDWLSFRATRRVLGLAMLCHSFLANAGLASGRSAMYSFLAECYRAATVAFGQARNMPGQPGASDGERLRQ